MNRNLQKVLLIHPAPFGIKNGILNLKYPPIGITILASILRKNEIKPFLFDANIEGGDPVKKIITLIADENIKVVGLSFTSYLANGAYYLAKRLKEEIHDVIIIAGGYHPTVMPDEVISMPSIDYVVIGEGEITFPQLLHAIKEDVDPASVLGICYKDKGKIIYTGKRPLIQNLDDIPFPAYDLLNLQKYSSLSTARKPFVTLIRSRGCPFNCIFCGVDAIFSHQYRCQSPQRTLKEMTYLITEFGVREIAFKDSDFLINRSNVEELCELIIRKSLNFVWSCSTRVSSVDNKLLQKMRQAGCKQITYGLESGSQKMLDVLQKDFTIQQAESALRMTKENGIKSVGGFIIGAPGEDHSTLLETVKFIKKIDLDYASFYFLTAFPGSDLFQKSIANKWFVSNQECPDYEDITINASNLSVDELKRAMRSLNSSFYFRPSYILKRLSHTTPSEMQNSIKEGFKLLRKVLKFK